MSTGKAALDRTQYVKISNGDESLVLQSHRDTVRIAVSELQPAIDNEAFHEVGGAGNAGRQNILNLNYVADPVWALAMTDNSSLSVTTESSPIRQYASLSQSRLLTTTLQQDEIATIEGASFSAAKILNNFDVGTPVYLLVENPVGSGVNIAFQKRRLKTFSGGVVRFQVLWDYDVTGLTGTVMPAFNENNLYRFTNPSKLDIRILNSVTAPARGDWTINNSVIIPDEGIEREPDFINAAGQGSNTAGGVSPDSGFRIYGQGTGALVKVTATTNDDRLILGYKWTEVPVTL